MSSNQPISSSNNDYETVVREMIKHENELRNQRVNWLLTFHGLLFTALGFAWNKSDTCLLINIFSVLGILISVSSITALNVATGAIRDLSDWWEKRNPFDQGPGVIGRRTTKLWMRGFYPWNLFPVLFIFAWLLILIVNFCRF